MKSVAGNVTMRGRGKESDLNSRWKEQVLKTDRGPKSSGIKN